MGYARLLSILANVKQPVSIKALAVCTGMDDYKVYFFLERNAQSLGIRFEADRVCTEEMICQRHLS